MLSHACIRACMVRAGRCNLDPKCPPEVRQLRVLFSLLAETACPWFSKTLPPCRLAVRMLLLLLRSFSPGRLSVLEQNKYQLKCLPVPNLAALEDNLSRLTAKLKSESGAEYAFYDCSMSLWNTFLRGVEGVPADRAPDCVSYTVCLYGRQVKNI